MGDLESNPVFENLKWNTAVYPVCSFLLFISDAVTIKINQRNGHFSQFMKKTNNETKQGIILIKTVSYFDNKIFNRKAWKEKSRF